MQERVITKSHVFDCNGNNGYSYAKDKHIGCHPHETPVNLIEGIEISCNSYFCSIYNKYFDKFRSTNLAYKKWHQHVSSFGIGSYMNNDFITGSPGKLPTSYFENYIEEVGMQIQLYSMAIGQGELLLTPIQMANITCIIANRGFFYTPHIVKNISGENSIDSSFTKKDFAVLNQNTLIQ